MARASRQAGTTSKESRGRYHEQVAPAETEALWKDFKDAEGRMRRKLNEDPKRPKVV